MEYGCFFLNKKCRQEAVGVRLKKTDNWGADNLSAAIVAKNRYSSQEKQQKLYK